MNLERKIDMEEIKKRGRGKGKTPALVSTSMRLPIELIESFKKKYPNSWQAGMRKVLTNYIKRSDVNVGS
jgi:hypothetical protein